MSVPISYLLGASNAALEHFELNRLNQAANMAKEVKEMAEEVMTLRVEAGVANWLRINREELLRTAGSWLEQVQEVAPKTSRDSLTEPTAIDSVVEGAKRDAA